MKQQKVLILWLICAACAPIHPEAVTEEKALEGLLDTVDIYRDQWGVNHIYAKNQHDLFFSQGYAAAKDRLFQFEIWRRQATGTVAELLGPSELKRDIGTRLFKFRGDMIEEMNYYHPQGQEIIEAYVAGVNRYIEEALQKPERLPLQFKMLGIRPQKWTPEVVISRHQGLLGNIGQELEIGKAVSEWGVEKVKELLWFHPKDPLLELDPKINQSLLFEDILALYNAFRKPVIFRPEHLLEEFRSKDAVAGLNVYNDLSKDSLELGSNNWVVAKRKSKDGNTYMANDPHRRIAVPSLRYMAHLVAPGWNVIGGGEPEIPGISIGHNEYGAWGLTVFRTDGEDLLQYELNPKNPLQYKHNKTWKDFKVITETIAVKGQADHEVTLYYSHHGPVTYLNKAKGIAYAVRCAWLEPGGAPYLASLRMDQATDWESFRAACAYSHIPGENMIWADRSGTIGWQAVGIAPIRKNFSGLVPVPGDGSYEWEGYLPILEKPHSVNPDQGFIATANQNVTKPDYSRWDAIGYSWSDPYRGQRIEEVLQSRDDFGMDDMMALQTDVTSLPARILVPYLKKLRLKAKESALRDRLMNWDFQLESKAIEASLYVAWENEIIKEANARFVPKSKAVIRLQLKRIIDWIEAPEKKFQNAENRDAFLRQCFENALVNLSEQLGSDPSQWVYGQPAFKHSKMTHALGDIATEAQAQKLNVGPLPRGGNGYTPNSTGNNLNQSSGASFRMIVNTGDWDSAVGTNAPGQSGDPESPYYSNLFEDWAADRYFPLYFSKEKIKNATEHISRLKPLK